jgi:hypothetical protein
MSVVLGIDPGANTGMAVYEGGKLKVLLVGHPWNMHGVIKQFQPDRVVFEDSRLQSNVWSAVGNRAVACNIARKVGQVDAWCTYLVSICEALQIPCHGISPKEKGGKVDAEEFKRITGWTGTSNEHMRDAAMVAWKYRSMKGA